MEGPKHVKDCSACLFGTDNKECIHKKIAPKERQARARNMVANAETRPSKPRWDHAKSQKSAAPDCTRNRKNETPSPKLGNESQRREEYSPKTKSQEEQNNPVCKTGRG